MEPAPEIKEIVRYGPPSALDALPPGTICIVEVKPGVYERYKQVAAEDKAPVWIKQDL